MFFVVVVVVVVLFCFYWGGCNEWPWYEGKYSQVNGIGSNP